MIGKTNSNAFSDASWVNYIAVRNRTKTVINEGDINVGTLTGTNSGAYMFQNCTSLISITLDLRKLTGTNSGAHMFRGCTSLISITLDLRKLTGDYSGAYMFQNCTSLVTANLDLSDFGGDYAASYMFQGCTSLVNLNFTLPKIGGNRGMQYMFQNCTSLVNVTLDLSNAGFCTEGCLAFLMGCTKLEYANIDTRNMFGSTTWSSMFNGCSKLNTVVLNMASANEVYGSQCGNMFAGCVLLNNLTFNGISNNTMWNQTSVYQNPFAQPQLSVCQNLTITCDILPNLYLAVMTSLNLTSVIQVLGKLHDYSGGTAHTITFNRAFTGLSAGDYALIDAAKTTAVARNWTVAGLTYSM